MPPSSAGVWITAMVCLSAPITAAVIGVAFRYRNSANGKDGKLATDNKARLDVLDAHLKNFVGWLEKIEKKLDRVIGGGS